MRRVHSHPCESCGEQVVCNGDLERNVDGWPEVVCDTYDRRRDPCWCEDCRAVAERDAADQVTA